MSKKISKNISTYELAIMVANEFSDINKRLDELNDQFAWIEGVLEDADGEAFPKKKNR
jgi:hypothetical protein